MIGRSRGAAEGSGSFLNGASAELAEMSKVARLGQRPLLRKAGLAEMVVAAAAAPGAAIRVRRFSEPLRSLRDPPLRRAPPAASRTAAA